MKRILILSALALLAATPFSYSNNPECDNLNIMLETKNDLNKTLNSFDFNFRESFDTPSVRGIQKADYYSCNGKDGYLLIYQHDRVILFKDIPMENWFEFKFANSPETYYAHHIKYKFVRI